MTAKELLNFIFECAINDRKALADCYEDGDEWQLAAFEDIKKFKALRAKLLPLRGPSSLQEWLDVNGGEMITANPLTAEGKETIRKYSQSTDDSKRTTDQT